MITSSKISSAPCSVAERAQRLQEFRALQEQSVVRGHGLDDHGRDLGAFVREQALRGRGVVERQHARERGELGRHALRRRLAERREARARGDEQVIDVAVIAARELHHEVAARRAAREPDRAHHGLGARRYEAHLLDAGIGRNDLLGELDLRRGRRAVRHAAAARRLDRRDDLGMRVAQDQRAPRADEVEVLAAVDVDDRRALGRANHERRAADAAERTHGGVHAARRDLLRAVEPRVVVRPVAAADRGALRSQLHSQAPLSASRA